MKKALLLLLLTSASLGYAQSSALSVYWNHQLGLNILPYDSIRILNDTNAASQIGAASYTILDNRYVTSGYHLNQYERVRYHSLVSHHLVKIIATDYDTGDTNAVYSFYRNQDGHDTAFAREVKGIYPRPVLREYRKYFYNSANKIDSLYITHHENFGKLTGASSMKFYYTAKDIDSTLHSVMYGQIASTKSVFVRDTSGKIVQERFFSDQGNGMKLYGFVNFIYASFGAIAEAHRYFNDPVNSQSQLEEVHEFYKKAVFSIKEDAGLSWLVYPNPAREVLHVKKELPTQFSYEIFNINGVLVSSGTGSHFIDISELGPGIYILKLSSPDATEIRKILVQ